MTTTPNPAVEGLERLFDQAFSDGIEAGRTGDHQLLAGSALAYAQAAIAAMPTPGEWRPIQEADKNERVLGYMPNVTGSRPYKAVIWWDDEFAVSDCDDDGNLTYESAWTAGRVGSFNYEEYAAEQPTHWQPLPPPPLESVDG